MPDGPAARRAYAEAARRSRRSRRRVRAIVLGGLFLLALGVVAVLRSPAFYLRVITVRGNQAVGREEIIEASGLRPGASLFVIRLGPAREGIEALPRIRSAVLRRVWPDGLDVVVFEHDGLVLVPCGRGWLEVSGDGFALELHMSSEETGFPVLEGIEPATIGVGELIPDPGARMAIAGLADLIAAGEELRSAGIGPSGLEVTLAPDIPVRLGPADAGLGARVAAVLPIVAEVRSRGLEVEYIDVRVPGQPVVKPR